MESESYNVTLLGGDGKVDDIPVKRMVVRAAAAPKAEIPLEPQREGAMGEARAVYIRADVEPVKYGFTDGCKGCSAAEAGRPSRNHSDESGLKLQ